MKMTGKRQEATRGILDPRAMGRSFVLSRPSPSADLAAWLDPYWIVRWDLRGKPPYRAETLPFPAVYIAIESRRPELYGVVSRKFSRRLTGRGRVFGIKFRPAMFHSFLGYPVSRLTDRVLSLRSVFGSAGSDLREAILAESDDAACIALFESFLRARLPGPDPLLDQLRDLVERVEKDRAIVRAEQIAALAGFRLRTLQLAFSKYVGVSPKWLIQRYRLQEAAELLAREPAPLADLAASLGYFDQSHFIREFRQVIGHTPARYSLRTSERSWSAAT